MTKNAVKSKKGRFLQNGKLDITFLSFVLILLTIGLVMLFSASYAYSYENYGNSYKFIVKQAMFAVAGIGAMFIFSKIDYHIWRKFSWVIYAVTIAILIFLLVAPPMVSGMDVKRWFAIGPISFQPSELAKFAIVVLFSTLISANQKQMRSFKFVAILVGLLGLTCVLVVLEPHLSATLLIAAIGVVLIYVGGLDRKIVIGGLVVAAVCVVLVIITQSPVGRCNR